MILLDGSQGEGGGQIVRSSLALSILTGKPFTLKKIRAGRSKPGLLAQHLAAVKAAAKICGGEVKGGDLGSKKLEFHPGPAEAGSYTFAVGTAGSATLVLHTVLPPLLACHEPSELILEGGTHNPFAPPFEHLEQSFFPAIAACGPRLSVKLERHGFFPKGGGRIVVRIEPVRKPTRLQLLGREGDVSTWARALVSRLPTTVGERELGVLREELGWSDGLETFVVNPAHSIANVLTGGVRFGNGSAVFTEFGEKGLPAEEVAAKFAAQAEDYLTGTAPVEEHLADQLIVPCAAMAGATYRAAVRSSHLVTNAAVFERFADAAVAICPHEDGSSWIVEVPPLAAGRAYVPPVDEAAPAG